MKPTIKYLGLDDILAKCQSNLPVPADIVMNWVVRLRKATGISFVDSNRLVIKDSTSNDGVICGIQRFNPSVLIFIFPFVAAAPKNIFSLLIDLLKVILNFNW